MDSSKVKILILIYLSKIRSVVADYYPTEPHWLRTRNSTAGATASPGRWRGNGIQLPIVGPQLLAFFPDELKETTEIVSFREEGPVSLLRFSLFWISNNFPGVPGHEIQTRKIETLNILRHCYSGSRRFRMEDFSGAFLEKLFSMVLDVGDDEILGLLLQSGFDHTIVSFETPYSIFGPANSSATPLEYCLSSLATYHNNSTVLDLSFSRIAITLLSGKPTFDKRYQSEMILHDALCAAMHSKKGPNCIKVLLDHGAPVSSRVLMQAKYCNAEVVRLLRNQRTEHRKHGQEASDLMSQFRSYINCGATERFLPPNHVARRFGPAEGFLSILTALDCAIAQRDVTVLEEILTGAPTIVDAFCDAPRIIDKELKRIVQVYGLRTPLGADTREAELAEILIAQSRKGDTHAIQGILPSTATLEVSCFQEAFEVALEHRQEDVALLLLDWIVHQRSQIINGSDDKFRFTEFYLDYVETALEWKSQRLLCELLDIGISLEKLSLPVGMYDQSILDELLEGGADVDYTALASAMGDQKWRLAESLLGRGNLRSLVLNKEASSLLQIAVDGGQTGIVISLLRAGVNPDDYGALLSAKDLHLRQMLISEVFAGDDRLSARQSLANHEFAEAVRDNNCERAMAAISSGADITIALSDHLDRQDKEPYSWWGTALRVCVQKIHGGRYADMIRLLLENGADPNRSETFRSPPRRRKRATTAFLESISGRNIDVIRQLLSAGVEVNPKLTRYVERTPLQRAVEVGNMEIVRLLLDKGADVNASPCVRGGATALQLAAITGNMKLAVEFIQFYGAKVSEPRAKIQGRTAFEGAAEHGRIDMIQLLWNETGGNGFGDEQHERAAKYARKKGHFEAAEWVEKLVRERGIATKELPMVWEHDDGCTSA